MSINLTSGERAMPQASVYKSPPIYFGIVEKNSDIIVIDVGFLKKVIFCSRN